MSSRARAQADSWEFTEVWMDPTAIPPYVLILLCASDGHCGIFDPARKNKRIFSCGDYEAAKLWLLEDEYVRVSGRVKAEQAA